MLLLIILLYFGVASLCRLTQKNYPMFTNKRVGRRRLKGVFKELVKSCESEVIPELLKSLVITPRLRNQPLIQILLHRPISNLPYLSKILEEIIGQQLHCHLFSNHLYEVFQSGCRLRHSTETAIVRVTNDILMSFDLNRILTNRIQHVSIGEAKAVVSHKPQCWAQSFF